MQSRSIPSVGASLSRLIYLFVCVFVYLSYLFFFFTEVPLIPNIFSFYNRDLAVVTVMQNHNTYNRNPQESIYSTCVAAVQSHI